MKCNLSITLFYLFLASLSLFKSAESSNFFEANMYFMELYPGKDPLELITNPLHKMKLKAVILNKGSLYFTNPLSKTKIEGRN